MHFVSQGILVGRYNFQLNFFYLLYNAVCQEHFLNDSFRNKTVGQININNL